MIKQTVTYEDFNGNTVTEDLFFHINRSEMIDMEIEAEVKASDRMKRLEQTQDPKEIYSLMKMFVQDSYGIKSEDGKRFMKSREIHENFRNSAAYDEFFFSLFTDTQKVVEFVNGIMPQKAMEEALAEAEKRKIQLDDTRKPGQYTKPEFQEKHAEEPRGTFGQPLEGDVEPEKKSFEDLSPAEARQAMIAAGLIRE